MGWVAENGQESADYPISQTSDLSEVIKEVKLESGIIILIQLVYSNEVSGVTIVRIN